MPRIIGYDISITGDTLNGPYTILDNQSSITTVVNLGSAASNRYVQLQYSLIRNGETRTGLISIANDGIDASITDSETDTDVIGVTFFSAVSGGNILLEYLSTGTGFDAQLKFFKKSWA